MEHHPRGDSASFSQEHYSFKLWESLSHFLIQIQWSSLSRLWNITPSTKTHASHNTFIIIKTQLYIYIFFSLANVISRNWKQARQIARCYAHIPEKIMLEGNRNHSKCKQDEGWGAGSWEETVPRIANLKATAKGYTVFRMKVTFEQVRTYFKTSL